MPLLESRSSILHDTDVISAFLKMLLNINANKDPWESIPHGMDTHLLSTLISQGPQQVFTASQPHSQTML